MDPLSDVLRAVKLNGAYFYLVEAAAPWSVSALAARELLPRILPEAEHLISYHILLSGSCWAGVDGEPQVRMEPGDVVVFPQGDTHLMSSAEGHRARAQKNDASPDRYPNTVLLGTSDNRSTTFVCGFLGCDVRRYNPLLSALPSRMHVAGIAGDWLSQFPEQVVAESRAGRIGSETMLTRMAELMFVEVVRRHVERLEPHQTGWFAALRDTLSEQRSRSCTRAPRVSRSSSACRLCWISRAGDCSSLRSSCRADRRRLRRSARRWATSPTLRSVGRSRGKPGCHRRRGDGLATARDVRMAL
jgi:hypothetical protein